MSIFFAYTSDFINAPFTPTKTDIAPITIFQENSDLEKRVVFLYFWCGFLREEVMDLDSSEDDFGLLKVYYPFFILLIMLIFEKISQLWLFDKFGTTDKIINTWKELEDTYTKKFEVQELDEESAQYTTTTVASRQVLTVSSNLEEKNYKPLITTIEENFIAESNNFRKTVNIKPSMLLEND